MARLNKEKRRAIRIIQALKALNGEEIQNPTELYKNRLNIPGVTVEQHKGLKRTLKPLWMPRKLKNGYKCMVNDPPWYYDDRGSRMSPEYSGQGRIHSHYSQVPTDLIIPLVAPFRYYAAKDAILFLWSTWAHLEDGDIERGIPSSAELIAYAMGFKPKTAVVWVKGRFMSEREKARKNAENSFCFHFGGGHSTRGASEPMLICTRGNYQRLIKDKGIPNVIFGPARGAATKHSKKPESSYRLIEKLMDGPRLEMFCRERRKGWQAWGDGVPQPKKRALVPRKRLPRSKRITRRAS